MVRVSAKFAGVGVEENMHDSGLYRLKYTFIKLIQLFDIKTGRSDSAYFIVRWFAAELNSTNLSIHFDKHEPMENDDKPFRKWLPYVCIARYVKSYVFFIRLSQN